MATTNNSSSIALAFAGKTASVDIPKPRDGGFPAGRDSFAAVVARSLPSKQQPMLPTPPNSISPSLPPQAFKRPVNNPDSPPSAPTHVDSDIDLQDAVDHANSQDQPQHHALNSEALDGLADLDSAGAITPGLLAKHHLPDILLAHGPLAIRHVMGYLTTTVPGFSRMPPAKARRLVVGALEGRGSGGEGGGIHGNVEFEKVGWGRWDARIKGQPPRQGVNPSPPASVPSSYYQGGLQIRNNEAWPSNRTDLQSGTSMAGDSAVFSHSEMDYGDRGDVTMLEYEADKMSLDGEDDNAYCSSSEAPDDPALDEDLGDGDVTDEEDWAQIGAAALRARSFPNASGGGRTYNTATVQSKRRNHRGGGPVSSTLAKSMPATNPVHNIGFSFPDGVGGDLQERAAVEALLRLGSM